MRSLGIDLAAQPKNSATCLIRWGAGGAVVEPPQVGADDASILEAMAHADWTGIDAPFGWPERFIEAVYGYRHLAAWPELARSDELRLRTTDRLVTHAVRAARGVSVQPLSVSSDRIATCAWRCASLLSEHHRRAGTVLDRIGVPLTRDSHRSRRERIPTERVAEHRAIEVYPAAALAMWGLPHRGYKAARASDASAAITCREAIVAGIERATGGRLAFSEGALAACIASDHSLDAFVSALVAAAAANDDTILPGLDERGPAQFEGWIHVPTTGSLDVLGPGRGS
jgi:predicted nuclease with RNAse H fold